MIDMLGVESAKYGVILGRPKFRFVAQILKSEKGWGDDKENDFIYLFKVYANEKTILFLYIKTNL